MSCPSQLLVSVASLEEALLAAKCGADILDIKEPRRGSLGMADQRVLREILAEIPARDPGIPLSAACGELWDWLLPGALARAPELRDVLSAVTFAKLGLAGMGANRNWPNDWLRIRRELAPGAKWIAVAYVDHEAADSPGLDVILEAACETGCAGILLDTHSKSARRLFDFVSPSRINELTCASHRAGLLVAVAGRLQSADWPQLEHLDADIIAVRSAACRDGNREAGLDAHRLREWTAWCARIPARQPVPAG